MNSASIFHALRRGVFHTLVGSVFAIAVLLLPRLPVIVILATVTGVFLSFELARMRLPRLSQHFSTRFAYIMRKEETSKLTGSSYFLIGCLSTALIFPREVAFLAILFLSFGDPAATVFGMWKGRTRLWNKSVEGDIACLIVCLLLGSLLANTLGSPPWMVAITGAVFATLFQALPAWLNDNLTIPLGSALAMTVINALV